MKYYMVFTDESKTAIATYGKFESRTLSTNHPIEWFTTEAELEYKVNILMGEGYYKANKGEEF